MSLPVATAMALCAGALALTPVRTLADPRGIGEPPPPLTPELLAARRAKLSESMAAWMPRMVGRFTVEGVADFNGEMPERDPNDVIKEDPEEEEGMVPIDPQKIKIASGNADCVAIGKGPGVHCVFHVSWIPDWTPLGSPVDGGEPFLAPAMKLFGLDPHTPLIHQLQLDTDGVAELESTTLKGNTVRWIYETRCESDTNPLVRCRRITRFYAPVGSSRVQLAINFEKWVGGKDWVPVSSFMLDMRREAEDQVAQVSNAPVTSEGF